MRIVLTMRSPRSRGARMILDDALSEVPPCGNDLDGGLSEVLCCEDDSDGTQFVLHEQPAHRVVVTSRSSIAGHLALPRQTCRRCG